MKRRNFDDVVDTIFCEVTVYRKPCLEYPWNWCHQFVRQSLKQFLFSLYI